MKKLLLALGCWLVFEASAFAQMDTAAANALLNAAIQQENASQPDSAQGYYTRLSALIEPHKKSQALQYSQYASKIAGFYGISTRYEEALSLLEECALLVRSQHGNAHLQLATLLEQAAALHIEISRPKAAIKELEQAIAILKVNQQETSILAAQCWQSLANAQTDLENIPAALAAHEQSLAIAQKFYGADSREYAAALGNFALTLAEADRAARGLPYLRKAIGIYGQHFPHQHPIYIRALNSCAQFWYNIPNTDSMRWYALEALRLNSGLPNLELNDPFAQKLENAPFQSVFLMLASMEALAAADAKAFELSRDKNPIHLRRAIQHTMSGVGLVEARKPDMSDPEELLTVARFESILASETLWRIAMVYQAQPDAGLFAQAFDLMEITKSSVLLATLRDQNAARFGGLSPKQHQQREELAHALNQAKEQYGQARTDLDKASARNAIQTAQNRLRDFQNQLKTENPRYAALRGQAQRPSIAEIQAKLPPKSVCVEYFSTDTALYVVVIAAQNTHFQLLPARDQFLREEISELRRCISDPIFVRDSADVWKRFVQSSSRLYDSILRPLEPHLAKAEHLFIIPDKGLNDIPFEVLLTDLPNSSAADDYKNLPYLLRRYRISYQYSLGLWWQNLQAEPSPNRGHSLLMAASYDGQSSPNQSRSPSAQQLRRALKPLPAARREVLAISELFSNQLFLDGEATEAAFKRHAPSADVIHLAMHGLLNEQYPLLSAMAFTENGETGEDNFLEAWEISEMRLQARLVVLSACETGYGRFEQGEGTMSLARSFMYAGTPALVVSLWAVNDQSTALLMRLFYEKLATGLDKAEALRQAKLTYLETAQDLAAHPAFWSAFVQLGDSAPVYLAPKGGGWWVWAGIGGGVLGLVAIGALGWRRLGRR